MAAQTSGRLKNPPTIVTCTLFAGESHFIIDNGGEGRIVCLDMECVAGGGTRVGRSTGMDHIANAAKLRGPDFTEKGRIEPCLQA